MFEPQYVQWVDMPILVVMSYARVYKFRDLGLNCLAIKP
jgi:hypothetical protein